MTPRSLVFLAVALAALLAAGCTPKYPRCETDAHCTEKGEVCVMGSCQQCGRDGDCKPGFACRDAKCVPGRECAADADCPAGKRCRAERCVPECAVDLDCAAGLKCRSGRCAPGAECASNADCPAGKVCGPDQSCVAAAEPPACQLARVHFEFNQSALSSEARAALDRNAECLRKAPRAILLSGHADERGTEEYNLHLGERRAQSVKKYLLALGVEERQLTTVSYGEERPSAPGQDERAWAQNRRVEFEAAPERSGR